MYITACMMKRRLLREQHKPLFDFELIG